ncbi:MAG: hypothetical protein CL946_07385 [Ectothiorhodospiraceae bacterium]|nr:hypothetical protein [Ectothiorhodospiraceae bacterium]
MKYHLQFTYLLASLFIAFIIAGCSSSGPVIGEKDSVEQIIQKVNARTGIVKTHKGYGQISMDSPEFSGQGSIDLRIAKPDSAYLKIGGPFGMSIALGLITSEQLKIYDGFNNVLREGETTERNLHRVFGMSVQFDEILDVLTGTAGIEPLEGSGAPTRTMAGSAYGLVYSNDFGSREYHIDPDYGAITRIIERDKAGAIVYDISYRDFRKVEGEYLPYIIKVMRPQQDESLSIKYDRQFINERPIDFAFSVPESARKIEL